MANITYISMSTVLLLFLALFIITTVNLVLRLFWDASLPPNLPWIGTGGQNSLRNRAKANLASILNLRELLDEGYRKYSKANQTYVLPYYINGPQVILPNSQIKWLLEQPDWVLSQERVNRQFLEADYTFLHANLVDGPVHPDIIQHQLTKKIGTFTDDIIEEANLCLEETWGLDTEEWREVKVYDTMLILIARLSTRVFIGLPLCRNPHFLKACSTFIRNVALAAAAISLFPGFLKPLVAPIFTLYDYIQYQKCCRFIMPIIQQRLSQLRDPEPGGKLYSQPSNDYIQWAIDHALAKPVINRMELDPRVLACRFSVLAFAAIQSSVITLTNTLFDLAASPECIASLTSMRDEVIRETTPTPASPDQPTKAVSTGSAWSKGSLARMTHVDSALRESLRLNGFIERGIMKMVVAPEGVTLPDGSHIPCGTKVGVSGYSIHHDEDIYPDANRYDAFRFARGQRGGADKKWPQALVNTSEKFLGFSHGSHACPGRFFAANQLKIALAHISLLYEIEPIRERPVNPWFFGHIGPPMSETLRVRRRAV
ncbi:cytochrome P450 [Hypomontagnella submonticulosa]|nr:cytochrome P450 [Hypomontagnella submonticulosa]